MLPRLTALQRLDLSCAFDAFNAKIFTAAMPHVALITSLTALWLSDSPTVPPSSLTPLSALTALLSLQLDDTPLARGHFKEIARIGSLERVAVYYAGAESGECIAELRPLVNLRLLSLTIYGSTMHCLEAGLAALAGSHLQALVYNSEEMYGPDADRALEGVLSALRAPGLRVHPHSAMVAL
jgi:hypothetical protein